MKQESITTGQNEKNHGGQFDSALKELRQLGVSARELANANKIEIGGEGLSGKVGNISWRLKREGEDDFKVSTDIELGATDIDISKAIEIHRAKYEGMTEEERAQHFWETWLHNEVRIQTPQNLDCEFAIVIPAMNEKPERILKQIESIKNQKDIDLSKIEVIYVIGNDLPTDDLKSKEIVATNQRVIETLRGISGLNVFVIDKSSPGHEIVNTNIGKARNRGVAEASLRFYENRKNGILIQTDSDSYFEDENYLSKLRAMTDEDPDIIGIAGGIVFEFSPDTTNEEEIAELRQKVEMFVLIQKWDLLVQFLRDPDYSYHIDTKAFSGANMIVKVMNLPS